MKKAFMILAIAASCVAVASCGNNKKAAVEAEPAVEEVVNEAEEAVEAAAEEVAEEAAAESAAAAE